MEVHSSGDPAANAGTTDTGQALNDIQNYLEEFNKDIQAVPAEQPARPAVVETNAIGGFGDAGQNGAPQEVESVMMVKEVSGLEQLAEASEQLSAVQAQAEQAAAERQEPAAEVQEEVAPQVPEEENVAELAQPTEPEEAPQLEAEAAEVAEHSADDEIAPHLEAMEVAQEEDDHTVHIVTSDGQPMISDLQSVQLVAVQGDGDGSQPQLVAMQPETTAATTVTTSASSGANQVVLNTGGSYQTVTIMPSDNNQSGEVSYVLIVSQPDDEKSENQDMSVYDFKEEAKGQGGEFDEDGTPRKQPPPRKLPAGASPSLMCSYCNYTSPKRYLLTRHMKCHSEERPHKCAVCDRGFKTIASLNNHVNTHTGTRPHKCKECESAFTTSGELVRHVRYRHTFEKPHKCPECDYAAVELSKMKRHIRSHTGERPYQCPECSYASPDTYKLKRHRRIHSGEKPYECDICNARFTQSNSLKSHRLIHSGNKPVFQCELCPTTCGRKTDLRIHVQKLHTSDKPLQCKKCSKFFPDRYSYKIHLKTHDGEKCFKCDQCPYAALSARFLESHLLTHTGEKPFECDECDQTFRQKQLLRRHKNLHHNPDYLPTPKKERIHECGECGKAFAHKGNLLRHMAIHDPTNPLYQVVPHVEGEEEEDDEDEEQDEDDAQHVEIIIQQVEPGEDGEVQQLTVVHQVQGTDGQAQILEEVVENPAPKSGQELDGEVSNTVEAIFKNMQQQAEDEALTDTDGAKKSTRASSSYPKRITRVKPEEDEEVEQISLAEAKVVQQGRRGRRSKPEEEVEAEAEEAGEAVPAEEASPARRGRKKKEITPVSSPAAKKARKGKSPEEGEEKRDKTRKDIEECFGFGEEDAS